MNNLKEFHIKNGMLAEISLKTTESYFEYFKDGEYDSELFNSFTSQDNTKWADPIVIFDVGGFMGITAMLFAKLTSNPNSKIVIFEPNPYNHERILENLSLNTELSQKIEVINTALSDKIGTIDMFLSSNIDNGYSSTSRIEGAKSTISNHNLPSDFSNVTVNTETLDSFVEKSGLKPDIIKVDIEGAEHLFLLGAAGTIKKYKPVIYMELHSQYCALHCTQQLLKMGYQFDILKEESDKRLLIKAFYCDANEQTVMTLSLARQNYNIEAMNRRISDVENKITQQNLENLKKIKSMLSDIGIHGILRKIMKRIKK